MVVLALFSGRLRISLHTFYTPVRRSTVPDCGCCKSSGPPRRSRLRTRQDGFVSFRRWHTVTRRRSCCARFGRISRPVVASRLGITTADVLLRDVEPIHLRQRSTDPTRDGWDTDERSEQLALEPSRKRHGGEHGRPGIRRIDLVALVDVIVASNHVRHRPAERRAQCAERREVLVAELAAARRPVRQLLPRARMGARPDEIGQALRIVPVPRLGETRRADPSAESRHARPAGRPGRTTRAARVRPSSRRAYRRGRSIHAPGSHSGSPRSPTETRSP